VLEETFIVIAATVLPFDVKVGLNPLKVKVKAVYVPPAARVNAVAIFVAADVTVLVLPVKSTLYHQLLLLIVMVPLPPLIYKFIALARVPPVAPKVKDTAVCPTPSVTLNPAALLPGLVQVNPVTVEQLIAVTVLPAGVRYTLPVVVGDELN
jgi:hypothetical protein